MTTTHVALADVRASLLQAPRIFEGLIAGAPRQALDWREAPGAWTAIEVLAHLADAEITDWPPRVEKILSGGGRFPPFEREGGFARYRGWDAEALVGEFGQLRRSNVDRLDRLELSAPHLRLTGEHPEFGSVTLGQLLATWAAHDMAHVSQISRILLRGFGRHVGPWRRYFSLLKDWQPDA
jgi:DinB family protein